jgi:hypothetical protein
MNRGEYGSPCLKMLPTLVREWATSGYLAKRLARLIAKLASWIKNIAQNCQLLRLRAGFRLVALAGNNLPYHYSFATRIGSVMGGTNILPSVHYLTIRNVNQDRQEPTRSIP